MLIGACHPMVCPIHVFRQGPNGADYPDDGALNNGMVAPFLNMTIFGALWYQGENNVHECIPSPDANSRSTGDGGPSACGNILTKTGYACSTLNLVTTWRKQWSVTPRTTDPTFPFGIVSLAAGTSEGSTQNMPNFRLAQTVRRRIAPVRSNYRPPRHPPSLSFSHNHTSAFPPVRCTPQASYGFLPGPTGSGMEKTFIAQAYDAGDPGVRSPGTGRDVGPQSQVDLRLRRYFGPFKISFTLFSLLSFF